MDSSSLRLTLAGWLRQHGIDTLDKSSFTVQVLRKLGSDHFLADIVYFVQLLACKYKLLDKTEHENEYSISCVNI